MKQKCRDKKGLEWTCGKASKAFLEGLITGREIECEAKNVDKYKREVVVCKAGTLDINSELVKAGYAVAYTRYSKDYINMQEYAEQHQLGIWEGSFMLPEEYRRENSATRTTKKLYNLDK